MQIEWSPSPNFGAGRGGKKVIAIVDHITGGNFPGCLEWMQNPVAKASAGYLVTRTGRIIQMVKDADRSYHAGIVNHPNWALYDGTNPNSYTIGIEHEGFQGDLTEAQYQTTLWLHKDLIAKFGIPIDTDHIIGHYRIDSVDRPYCPGPQFPWDRLFRDLKGGEEEMDEVVVCFTPADMSTALAVSQRRKGIAVFCRYGAPSVHPDALKAGKVFNIGGPALGVSNEVYMAGNDAIDTMGLVYKAKAEGRL